MSRAILAVDITSALEEIEKEALAMRGELDEFELEGRMFRVLCACGDIRHMVRDLDKPVSEVTEMASALASKSNGAS